ncbi:ribosome-binding ATPase YchF [Spirochaetota bacterium]|nr:ribosome-binding ATPase YchF [Spirochaetota bacterium]
MAFSCGIVGLPNVGKSTLFNALTHSQVPAENYPFCTIEPNKATVNVPDKRIRALSTMSKSEKFIYTTIDFVDIAGLVKGAAKGQGLGNKFISHIKNVDAIAHVVRLFEDPNVIKDNPINPAEDVEIIHQELILYDLEQCDKHIKNLKKATQRTPNKTDLFSLATLKKAFAVLEQAHLLFLAHKTFTQEEIIVLKRFQLVSLKPVFIIANIDENEVTDPNTKNAHYTSFATYVKNLGLSLIELSAELECELSDVSESLLEDTISPYFKVVGIEKSGCSRLVKQAYNLLSLLTFFTTGESETRAWTVTKNTPAPGAAGRIHSDIEKGFISADVINADLLLEINSYKKARELGKIRREGKNYILQDGDVCHFKFNL